MSPSPTTIPLARNDTGRGPRSGPAAYARAARRYAFDSALFVARDGVVYKYHAPVKDAHTRLHGVSRVVSDTPASEVPAHDIQNDLEYVVTVPLGTPPTPLRLDFDTGSSDLWVWSSELRARHTTHAIYNPAKSSSAHELKGATWDISYGDGSSARGNVYKDTIHLGALVLPNQGIELAQELSPSFLAEGGSDGLLGLGFPILNTVQPRPVLTPVANLVAQRLASGVFSVALDHHDDKGFYTFGGIDAARAGVDESDIAYTRVDASRGYWMFESTRASVGGKEISLPSNTAIADTGTTLALVSEEIVSALYDAIPGAMLDQSQGGWIYPADAPVPKVSVAVGSKLYTINPSDLAFSPAGEGMVFGGIQSRGNNPFDILGDVWLKSVYVVFDQDQTRIGVAQRQGNVA